VLLRKFEMKKSVQARLAQINMCRLAKTAGVSLAGFGALVLSQGAQAAIDITAATAGITDAQSAALSVLALLITMAAALFGVYKVLGMLNRKG
jgi:hypothetical protein